jgi:ABC-type lipopolysaccharide export system ATPase subunit
MVDVIGSLRSRGCLRRHRGWSVRWCGTWGRHGDPILVETIFETIRKLNQEGTTILLVEQNAAKALQVANRGYVIETGQIVLEDSAANLRKNEAVRKAYLGEA